MTKPSRHANGRRLRFVLTVLTAVLITLFGAGTLLAAAPAAQTRVGTYTPEASVVVGLHGHIDVGQRLGNRAPTYDSALATGVVVENPVAAAPRLALESSYDGAVPIHDAFVRFVDVRTVVQVEAVGRHATAVSLRRHFGPVPEASVAVSGFVVAAKTVRAGGEAAKAEKYVYRVHGGDSPPMGHSWTPENPIEMANPRSSLGLPKGNAGQMLTRARVLNRDGMRTREALSLDGNPGGAQEWLFRDPGSQLSEHWTIPLVPPW